MVDVPCKKSMDDREMKNAVCYNQRIKIMLSVIIPTYNEEKNIRPLVERLAAALKKIEHELIFIDDHSTDDTIGELKRLRPRYAITIESKNGEKGKAASLLQGFTRARGDNIAMIDADLQYPPEDIPAMIAKLASADIVVGNRKIMHTSRLRMIASRIFTLIFGTLLLGLTTDVQSGLKVFRKETLNGLSLRPSPWGFDYNFLYQAHRKGAAITDHAIAFNAREHGDTKVNILATAVELGWGAIKLRVRHLPTDGVRVWKGIRAVADAQELIALGAIIVAGAVLRIWHITAQEFWLDEAFTGVLMQKTWLGMVSPIVHDVHPPLYYVLLKIWVSVFGLSDAALRGMSVVPSVALIPLAWVFVKRFFSTSALIALGVALVIATNPFLVAYAQEARSYTLFAFVLVATVYFFYKALTKSPLAFSRTWFGCSLLIALSWLTHYFTAVGLFGLFAFLVYYYKSNNLFSGNGKRIATLLMRLLLIPFLTFVAWLPILYTQLRSQYGLLWIPDVTWQSIPHSITAFLFGVHKHIQGIPEPYVGGGTWTPARIGGIALGVLIVASAVAFFRSTKKQQHTLLLLLICWVLPLVAVAIYAATMQSLYVERYFIPFAALFLIYSALVWANQKIVYVAIIGAFVVIGLVVPSTLPEKQLRPVAQYLAERATTHVVVDDPTAFLILKHYAKDTDNNYRIYDANATHGYASWTIITDGDVVTDPSDLRSNDIFVSKKGNNNPFPTGARQTIDEFSITIVE